MNELIENKTSRFIAYSYLKNNIYKRTDIKANLRLTDRKLG